METQLIDAVENGAVLDDVRTLLDGGADVNAVCSDGVTVLQTASWNGFLEMVRLLLDRGANVDTINYMDKKRTALHYAMDVGNENIEVVRLLLDHGADINARDVSGRTSIHYASFVGDLAIVRLLIDRGADINAVDKFEHAALWFASLNSHVEVIALLKKTKNVENTAYLQYTPFKRMPKELTQLLLTYL